jgi:hypothetical protein
VSNLAKEIGEVNFIKGNYSLWQIWPRVFVFLFSDFLSRERGYTSEENSHMFEGETTARVIGRREYFARVILTVRTTRVDNTAGKNNRMCEKQQLIQSHVRVVQSVQQSYHTCGQYSRQKQSHVRKAATNSVACAGRTVRTTVVPHVLYVRQVAVDLL